MSTPIASTRSRWKKCRRGSRHLSRRARELSLVGAGLTVPAVLALVLVAPTPYHRVFLCSPTGHGFAGREAYERGFHSFLSEKTGPVIMTSLGSSLTAGNGASSDEEIWGWKLETALGDRNTLGVHGYPGHTIRAIREDGGMSAVAAEHPDIVLMEPGTPNNIGQALSSHDSGSLTTKTSADLRSQLPDSFTVGIVPSPISDLGSNSLGLHYSDYVAGDREALRSANIVCDVFKAFTDTNTQIRDGVRPNDEGNTVCADAVIRCLTSAP